MGIGQFSGSKLKYTYTSDSGKKYFIRIDTDLVVTGSGLVPYDPATDAGFTPPPKRFKPRGVYWQSTAAAPLNGKRKFLLCGLAAEDLYANDAPQAVTIDGVAGVTTGRRGEKLSF